MFPFNVVPACVAPSCAGQRSWLPRATQSTRTSSSGGW